MSIRRKLSRAFSALEKQGFVTRKKFMCCQNCAGSALADCVSEEIRHGRMDRATIKGVVFWHKQDDEGLREDGRLYLAHGPLETVEFGTIGIDPVAIGDMVVAALQAEGLIVTWEDRNPHKRILVEEVSP